MQRTEKYFENDAFRKTAAGVILAAEADAKTPSPVTNRTKEGVNPTNFTSKRSRADGLACTQVHAAAGCRPCTAGTPSSTAQLPVDAALNAHGLTLLMVLL